MGLVVFDIGGTAVKHGYFSNEVLAHQGKFPTPVTFENMKEEMLSVIKALRKTETVEGVAISAPGAVNVNERRIDGISAVPYLHNRPIFDELQDFFDLPVTIENDANCAGIAEIELGAGKEANNVVFMVLGTGVGGSVFINRQIYKGAHLFAGEFGLMRNGKPKTLSNVGTIVKVANKYNETTNKSVTGKEIFELAEAGDSLAKELMDEMYDAIAESLYSIQVSIDPELVIIGGGMSARKEVADEISQRLLVLLEKGSVPEILPMIKTCHFSNDANLIGAAMNYMNQQK